MTGFMPSRIGRHSMAERPRYFILLILTIFIASSIYISWATDRAQGRAYYESLKISIDGPIPYSTTEVSFDVYQPRPSGFFAPYPIVLTIHGIGGSKEMMYAFNVELARRNFTVVSVDLPGHGDTREPFNPFDFARMAEVCYSVLNYVWDTFPNIDNSTYGVVAHSLGVGVAFAMADMEIAPSTIIAVGSDGDLGFEEPSPPRCNLLFAIGSNDELVSNDDALNALRMVSKNSSAQPFVTYGSFYFRNATRLVFGDSEHILELIDPIIVSESVRWMILALQGDFYLNRTAPVNDLIYNAKTYGTVVGSTALILSLFPLALIVNSLLNRFMKLPKNAFDIRVSFKHAFIFSTVLGIITSILLAITPVLYVSSILTHTTNLLSLGTGFLIFSILISIVALLLYRFIFGEQAFMKQLESLGINHKFQYDHAMIALRGLVLTLACLVWMFGLVFFASTVSGYEFQIIYMLFNVLSSERLVLAIFIAISLIPFTLFDMALMRGLLARAKKDYGKWFNTKRSIIMLAAKLTGYSITIIPIVIGLAVSGALVGPSVLTGLFYLLFLGLTVLTTTITIWSEHIKSDPWFPVFFNAMMYAWVFATIFPMV